MIGMTYPIDCVFLNGQSHVVGLVESISPGQLSPYFGQATCCLELPVGTIARTRTCTGDVIEQGDPKLLFGLSGCP
jgi:uncharacterized membrane protein (UPF0127 family)